MMSTVSSIKTVTVNAMGIIKNFPLTREAQKAKALDEAIKTEIDVRLKSEAAIDDLLEVWGKPPIYRATSELLKLHPMPPCCSFCGKGVNQVTHMIEGNGRYICDQCIMLLMSTIDREG